MRYSCFVEVPPEIERHLLTELIHASYVASHDSPVTLWFRAWPDEAVRAALDRAVQTVGTKQAGVEFLVEHDVSTALRRARGTTVCVLFDESLRSIVDSVDTHVVTAQEALALRTEHGCFCAPCSHHSAHLRTA
jgi:hypothetical protein